MKPVTEVMVGIGVVAIVVFVAVYAAQHITCWHVPYITNGCVISK